MTKPPTFWEVTSWTDCESPEKAVLLLRPVQGVRRRIARSRRRDQRLRAIITRQGMELLIAHSEALGLYDLTTLPAKEAT
jgi:hypothetical protein